VMEYSKAYELYCTDVEVASPEPALARS
jgi:hypothetical protein